MTNDMASSSISSVKNTIKKGVSKNHFRQCFLGMADILKYVYSQKVSILNMTKLTKGVCTCGCAVGCSGGPGSGILT
jgi:hypothetical protein